MQIKEISRTEAVEKVLNLEKKRYKEDKHSLLSIVELLILEGYQGLNHQDNITLEEILQDEYGIIYKIED
jgi:hypothetical protein